MLALFSNEDDICWVLKCLGDNFNCSWISYVSFVNKILFTIGKQNTTLFSNTTCCQPSKWLSVSLFSLVSFLSITHIWNNVTTTVPAFLTASSRRDDACAMKVSLDIVNPGESFLSVVVSGCEHKTCMIFVKELLPSLFAKRRCPCQYMGRLAMILSELYHCSCLPFTCKYLLSQKRYSMFLF